MRELRRGLSASEIGQSNVWLFLGHDTSMLSMRLSDKIALITGGSRGIGKATALRFAEQGADVAVNFVNDSESAEAVCESITAQGRKAIATQADVSNADEVERMIAETIQAFDRIDILVNNAGIYSPIPWSDPDMAAFDRLVHVNICGVIHCASAVAPVMRKNADGRIVNISSIAALGTGIEGTSGYAATKAAVLSVSQRMAQEWGPHGIRVNAICPGVVETDMVTRNRSRAELDAVIERAKAATLLSRMGRPEDIADVALFLASDESSFMTGQALTVDGGRMDYLTHSV
jgi:3-oxoacyl-[acyl-carrier protein] reductase